MATIISLCATLVILFLYQQPKLGYIRSKDVLFGYTVTKNIQDTLDRQIQTLESNIAVMSDEYSRSMQDYESKKSSLSTSEQSRYEAELKGMEMKLQQYISNARKKVDDEEKQKLEKILEYINTVVKKYAEEHDYTIIFGTATGGNIVYGAPAVDVTEDILRELNDKHKYPSTDAVKNKDRDDS